MVFYKSTFNSFLEESDCQKIQRIKLTFAVVITTNFMSSFWNDSHQTVTLRSWLKIYI